MRKFVLLVLALLICLFSSEACVAAPDKKPVAKKGANKTTNKASAKVIDKEVVKENQKSRSDIKYTGFETKRNPFIPPEVVVRMVENLENPLDQGDKKITLPKIQLQGIIWSKNIPQVIVNGGVMKVGEFIEDFEIKEIQRDGIVLFFKGTDYFVKMIAYTPPKGKSKKSKKR